MERRKRRAFGTEFKAERCACARLVIGITEVAEDLGLTMAALRESVRRARIDAGKGRWG
jgi:transposase-like protein